MTCFLACLPKILRSSDRILFITVTPFPGTKEMATHVYEMNKQVSEEKSASLLE